MPARNQTSNANVNIVGVMALALSLIVLAIGLGALISVDDRSNAIQSQRSRLTAELQITQSARSAAEAKNQALRAEVANLRIAAENFELQARPEDQT